MIGKWLKLIANEGLKMFWKVSFSAFVVKVENEYPELAEIVLKSLLFLSAYICETSFSVMSAI